MGSFILVTSLIFLHCSFLLLLVFWPAITFGSERKNSSSCSVRSLHRFFLSIKTRLDFLNNFRKAVTNSFNYFYNDFQAALNTNLCTLYLGIRDSIWDFKLNFQLFEVHICREVFGQFVCSHLSVFWLIFRLIFGHFRCLLRVNFRLFHSVNSMFNICISLYCISSVTISSHFEWLFLSSSVVGYSCRIFVANSTLFRIESVIFWNWICL